MTTQTELYTVKELASLLKKSPGYVYGMRKCGFVMLAGVASLQEARQWLADHASFNLWEAWSRRNKPQQSATIRNKRKVCAKSKKAGV